jgi:UDP-N-acetylmuramate dehydrogenase
VSAVERAAAVLGALARRDVPIGPLTTYRVGGAAALFVEAHTSDDLLAVSRAVQEGGLPVLVVGKGSNLLVADAGFAGIAVALGEEFEDIVVDGTRVRAGGAVALPVLARRTAAAGLTGFEWAVGVPGSVGGAVRMNAGGHGSDMSECTETARVVDLLEGAERTLTRDDLAFGYRRSSIAFHHVVVWADLELAPGDRATSETAIAEIVRWRREHQPGGQNAGSVFTNPPGDSAGRLVDAAGLKGLRVGSARVSEKHANFIQADEGGSADDVVALVREVQRRVEERTGVRLEPELRLIGFEEVPA